MTTPSAIHFVGVDPSLTATGLAILDEGGEITLRTIRTTANSHKSKFHRIRYIVRSVRDAIYSLGRAVVCLEGPYIDFKNGETTLKLVELHTILQYVLYFGGIPFHAVPPASLKKFVCGKGNAKKDTMMMEVLDRWKIKPQDNNQADAAGLAFISRAVHSVRCGRDRTGWHAYQLDIAEKIAAEEIRCP